MTQFRVLFRDKWRTTSPLILASAPVIIPRELRVQSRTETELVLGPPEGDELGADILAGTVPLVHFAGNILRVAWLDIPPPAPLTLEHLRVMWNQISMLGLPLPESVSAQGRLPSGRLNPKFHALLDYLEKAHRLACELLADWPTVGVAETRWQYIELPLGREDLLRTSRAGGRFPGFTLNDRVLPERSARRVGTSRAWTSSTLADAASRAVRALSPVLSSNDQHAGVLAPFSEIARRSAASSSRTDPPLSSWPRRARALLEPLRALCAIAEATQDAPVMNAPLSYVWRLYEAWVASEVFRWLDARGDTVRSVMATQSRGVEWLRVWEMSGIKIVACAQLEVRARLHDLGGLLPDGVRSLTSVLKPDVAVFVLEDSQTTMVVIDAKRRSAREMAADDIAEAASKYIWGLRLGEDDATLIDVEAAIIATSAVPKPMFSASSRVVPVQTYPGLTARLGEALEAALGLPPAR